MTKKERIFAAIRREKADCVPVAPQITYAACVYAGISREEGFARVESAVDSLVYGLNLFDYDGVYAGWESSFNLLAHAMGAEWKIPKGGLPAIEGTLIDGADALGKVRVPDPERDGRLPFHLELNRKLRDAIGPDVPIFSYIPGPLTVAGLLMGSDRFFRGLILEKELIHSVIALCADAAEAYATAKQQAGSDILVIGDPSASSSMISPDMFNEFAAPHIERLIHSIRRAGAVASLHICGRTDPIFDHIRTLRPDIFEVDSIQSAHDTLQAMNGEVCVQGNLDPMSVLSQGSADFVYRKTLDLLDQAGGFPGFILSSGCEIAFDTPSDNLAAMVRARNDFSN